MLQIKNHSFLIKYLILNKIQLTSRGKKTSFDIWPIR